ncbi:MAG: hypothetical protein WC924_03270 [Candidatus Gracilibacteria bacterium]
MKTFLSLLTACLLLSACNPVNYLFGNDVNKQTIDTEPQPEETSETYPLYLTTMTHMEHGWSDDTNENVFLKHVDQLRYGMDLAEEYDAILTVESEEPFARANSVWDLNIMKEVLDRGHGVGTHCDIGGIGQKQLTLEEQISEMKVNKKLVDDLVGAENNHGCSGAGGYTDWAQAAAAAGFNYLDGIVSMHLLAIPEENRPDTIWTDAYIAEHYHENMPENVMDRIYLMRLENTLDFEPDESGIVLSNGELGRVEGLAEGGSYDCPGACPYTNEDVDTLVGIIKEVNSARDPSQVAKLNIYLPANNFVTENEEVLRYLFSEMQKLQNEGVIEWASQWQVVEAYLESQS